MKPLSFENIKRLMGGGGGSGNRKKHEKETSFKRSDSFKRISIRKNYLDRGGKKKQKSDDLANAQLFNEESKLEEYHITPSNSNKKKASKENSKIENIYMKAPQFMLRPLNDYEKLKEEFSERSSVAKNLKSREVCTQTDDDLLLNESKELMVSNNEDETMVSTSSTKQSIGTQCLFDSIDKSSLRDESKISSDGNKVGDCQSTAKTSINIIAKKQSTNNHISYKKYFNFMSKNVPEKIIIHVPASEEIPKKTVRNNASLVSYQKDNVYSDDESHSMLMYSSDSVNRRDDSDDSAVEISPSRNTTEILKYDRSPVFSPRQNFHLSSPPPSLIPDISYESGRGDEMRSLSVSLGRIWMDAPLSVSTGTSRTDVPSEDICEVTPDTRVAHNSLDSALKSNKDDFVFAGGLQKNKIAKTGIADMFSSKDSGFSLTLSSHKLTMESECDQKILPTGFFLNAKQPVNNVKSFNEIVDLTCDRDRNSMRRVSFKCKKGSRKSGRRKKQQQSSKCKNDMYTVVVRRPPRSMTTLKLDPLIFVPPEKRKTIEKKNKPHKHGDEIRSCFVRDPVSLLYDTEVDTDEDLYEYITTDYSIDRFDKVQTCSSDDDSKVRNRENEPFKESDKYFPFNISHSSSYDSLYRKLEEEESLPLYVPPGVSPVPVRRPARRRPSRRKNSYKMRNGKSDITQKGYEKKRTRLLSPYLPKQHHPAGGGEPPSGGGGGGSSAGGGSRMQSRARRAQHRVTHNEKRYHSGSRSNRSPGGGTAAMRSRGNRRLTRNETRYHSEVRQEAVQQALAAMQSRPKPSLPMPSKRTSVMADSPRHDSASSSDDDSVVAECVGRGPMPPPSDSSGSPPPPPPQLPRRPPPTRNKHHRDIADLADVMNNLRPWGQGPDVTHTHTHTDRVNRCSRSGSDDNGTARWKVSAKIQQLLNTLKRPKRRPLPEFYEDDDIELEIAANPKDPNAPKPEGGIMTPAIGEQLVVPSGLPRNLEAAIQRYGSASFKAPVATVLDPNGKMTNTLTYGKLLSRSQKIAHALLNKTFWKGNDCPLKSGDRIALVYPNNDPINFMCAWYGCLQAGVVPVAVEVPLTRRDAGSQQIGFLLGSTGIHVALTSEACYKGLPKSSTGDVVGFKGWPRLTWTVTEHLAKTPKDWIPPALLSDDTPAYIEYTSDGDGSVMGVTVSRSSMLSHCRALTAACAYTEGEVMVCVLDFKREVGLWHGVLTSVLNGMHVIFIPYALMKVNPASWMHMITKYRASIAVVKSRDLHWGLLATKDHKDISLSSLRLLLVADGANPWSLSSCDQFLSVFQPKGLRPEVVCPCACSSEALTVCVRRAGRPGGSTGRGVLSMAGLSHGVVRVDQENSLTSLTLQDCGQVMPGSAITVVRMEGPPQLCKTDEVGEICVLSGGTGTGYWGLPGLTASAFSLKPLTPEGSSVGDQTYTRTGLLGFLGPGGLVFICGSKDGLMTVTGRKHNMDDIIATVLAVEPMKFIYRGRIAVFSIRVLRDDRVCVIAEQRPDCSEEESFQWMSRVLQAVDSIHQVGIYCLSLVQPNYLPKTPLGGIHLSECKRRFLDGNLHPANVLMCPHTCVTNLPKPREIHSGDCVADVGPASVMVGNLVQGNRLASAQGRDMGHTDDSDVARKYQFISEILRWRAQSTADHIIFTLLNSKGAVAKVLSCSELHKKAERIGNLLLEKGRVNTGEHVALIFPPGLELICAFYGCLYVGAVPVTIRPPHPQNLQTTLPTVRMIVDVSKSALVLSNQNVIKLLKSKEASNVVDIKSWPMILDTDDMPKKKLPMMYRAPTAEMLAYLDFSVSTTGMLAGIKMSHAAVTSLCRSMKLACELYPSRHIALCLDPYCGLGFALWCLSSIYSGHHSILIPPSEVEINPALWLSAVSQYRVRDTFCSYGVMELCTKGLGSSVDQLKSRGVSLGCVRTCVAVAEERPRIHLTASFSKLFSALGLSPRAVSTSFGCRVNIAICLQGASSPESSTVYVDLRALRNDRVSLVERGSPHSLCVMESGKLLPGVKVIIANPETKGQCGDSHLGEIWVQSSHNASGYFTIYGDESDYADHFNAKLVTGNAGEVYARTGYLGFLRRTEGASRGSEEGGVEIEPPPDCGDTHDAVFVVGALDETVIMRGMRYHPIDIENSVMRCHKKIAECAVFTWTNLLVVVAELDGSDSEALNLVPLITNAVLEEHHLVVGVVVVVDPGVVPINSRGEKQRMHLRDGFLSDQIDAIYIAYNM